MFHDPERPFKREYSPINLDLSLRIIDSSEDLSRVPLSGAPIVYKDLPPLIRQTNLLFGAKSTDESPTKA